MKHATQRGFSLPEMLVVISLVLVMLSLLGTAATSRLSAVQARVEQQSAVERTSTVRRNDLRIPLWRATELRRQHQTEEPNS